MFGTLTEAQLRNRLEPEKGIFIAESPKVIRVALDAGCEPLALLCEQKHITGDAADIVARCAHVPVYTGPRQLLSSLTGYVLTRGVLCAMRRPAAVKAGDVCREARRVVVIHGVTDTTNIGAIFRSAAALGIDAVLLTPDSCDPPQPPCGACVYGFGVSCSLGVARLSAGGASTFGVCGCGNGPDGKLSPS